MLELALILLLASNALAVSPPYHGPPLTPGLIERAFGVNIDEADLSSYIVDLVQLIIDLASRNDPISQATVAAQTVTVMTKLADGIHGDNCYTAGVINAMASIYNRRDLNTAIRNYMNITIIGIDHIVQLVEDPEVAKYTRGVAIGCDRGGRDYDIEGAWNEILSGSNGNNQGILNEQYSVVRNLYDSLYLLSNNVGAAATAAAVRPVTQIFLRAIWPVSNFIRAVANPNVNNNALRSAAANAKNALLRASAEWARGNVILN